MKRRADFVHAARGGRVHAPAFTMQVAARPLPPDGETSDVLPPRIGFTLTKKVGNAAVRNRIRRRLREAVRLSVALPTAPGTDYVIVARREALAMPFARLVADLVGAMRRQTSRGGRRKGRAAGQGGAGEA